VSSLPSQLGRYPVPGVDRDRRRGVGLCGIAALAGDLGLLGDEVRIDVGRFGRVGHSDRVRGRLRLLERIGDRERDVLPVIANDVVVERRPRLVQHQGVREVRRYVRDRSEVSALQNGTHARHLPGAGRIDGRYRSFGDRRANGHGVKHARKIMIGGIACRTGDLEGAIDAGARLADKCDRRLRF
jgi:hypothetical protein